MARIKRSDTVGHRLDFAAICNARDLRTAVEVGTDRGIFAADFLERWRGELLYCVDPWVPYPQMPWLRDGDLAMAAALLAPHARRVRIVRATSADAARWLGMMDFVYIDGSHAFSDCAADLELWWPSVRPGGLLAGHDFDEEHHEVKAAVMEFAGRHGLTVEFGTEYNAPPSWYFEKS
jgi:predicted O-methyltransferase YrrM